jgi:isoamylase
MNLNQGAPDPLGFSIQGSSANFALFSSHATKVTLGLFNSTGTLIKEIPLYQTNDIWHIGITDLAQGLEYAYRCEGPQELLYNPEKWLIDPYAKRVNGPRALASLPALFDWQDDRPPKIPHSDLIIYEMHVRGFTKHPSSEVSHPGTYLGVIEKIPYLKKLGVNAVELMPIFGFDHTHCKGIDPQTQRKRVNYWGYNPLHFFSPMSWYAVKDPVAEFKTLVRELHKNGIEVILDVVYNHTGEEDILEYYANFRGIDNPVYYMVDKNGKYRNYTGCGNTFNTHHPAVQKLILDSLRYWIQEMHVDGFRFDLASIFARDRTGHPMDHPPLLEAIKKDPVISLVKLIAEPWDAVGLYQLGYFPKWGPWSEWNDRYRDTVRRFIKGTDAKAGSFANVLCGSERIYSSSKTPLSSINFITAHDGFTLRDLVTYQNKHNSNNGENNWDGNNQNDSWNCGHEGPTEDFGIHALRERQMRNFLLALFISQGIPMLLMGDEIGHTRHGNNNPYVQDNEINWYLWDKQDPKIFQFTSSLIAFRLQQPQLRRTKFLNDTEVEWFTNWDPESRLVAFMLKGPPSLYIAFNAHFEPAPLILPPGNWRTLVNTSEDWIFHNSNGPSLASKELAPYSSIMGLKK